MIDLVQPAVSGAHPWLGSSEVQQDWRGWERSTDGYEASCTFAHHGAPCVCQRLPPGPLQARILRLLLGERQEGRGLCALHGLPALDPFCLLSSRTHHTQVACSRKGSKTSLRKH